MEMKNVKEIFLGGAQETTIADTPKSFTSSSIYSSYSFLDFYSTNQSDLGQEDKLKINFTITSNQGSPYIESMLTYYDENGSLRMPEFNINGTTNYDLTIKLTGTVDSNTWEVLLIQQYDSYGAGNNMRVELSKTGSSALDILVKNKIATSMFTLTINSIKLVKAVGVKKITNSNGDIIWGSYEEFPYRRLEYIHFNGAEYINDTYNPYPGMKLALTFKADIAGEMYTGTNRVSSGTGGGTTNNTLGSNANGKLAGWLLGSFRSYNDYDATDKHEFTIDRYNGKVYIDGTQVTSGTAQYGGTNTGGLYYGCRASASGELGLYMKANIYRITITNSGNTAWVRNMVPCQRKSDGVCGLYNVPSNTFYPMVGTTITDAAAGPVLDEYWDLTNPFN